MNDEEKPDGGEPKVIDLDAARRRLALCGPKKAPAQEASGAPPSKATDPLLDLARNSASYFTDDTGEPYAAVKVGAHRESVRLRSGDFRIWLDHLFYGAFGTLPKTAHRKDVLAVLEGMARFDGPRQAVHVRLAQHEDAIYLDLGNASREVVRISEDGWSVVHEVPVRFRRPRGMRPVPRPEHGGTVGELRPLINADDAAFYLLLAWLVGALRPRGPYPVLVIQGEQGSGKSTAARMTKGLIDASKAPLRSMPRSERDLAVATANAWVPGYDNLSGLSPSVSDAICRISTGGGISTRQLYTDADEVILEFTRPLIVNGIDDLAIRPDLAERALVLNFPTLGPSQRKDEKTLLTRFEEVGPRVLGALLDGVASALRSYGTTSVAELPRMADFARWVTAAEPGLGWRPGTFLETFKKHRLEVDRDTMDRDAVASLIPRLPDVKAGRPWNGTPTDLFRTLTSLADETLRGSPTWPRAPNALSAHLRRLAPVLRANGYLITADRRAEERVIVITRAPS